MYNVHVQEGSLTNLRVLLMPYAAVIYRWDEVWPTSKYRRIYLIYFQYFLYYYNINHTIDQLVQQHYSQLAGSTDSTSLSFVHASKCV